MRKVLGLFDQRRSLLLLCFYLMLCFILMAFNDPFKLRGIRIAILEGMSWVYSIQEKFSYLEDLQKENKELHRQVLELSLENLQMQENMLENIRLKRLLKFKEESPYAFVSGSVIGYGQEQTIRSLVLNVGLDDGVRKNQTVVTEQGLVGKILAVEPDQSITQILMDRNSLVSARLQKSREVGVVGWSGNLWLDLNYIPKEVGVEAGEVVLTSGLSRIYPPGIKVGIVAEVKENDYELFKQIKIKPAVDFNQLEEVFVIQSADTLSAEKGGD